jgi:hypothetical protein
MIDVSSRPVERVEQGVQLGRPREHMRGDADAVAAAGGPALLLTLEF